MVWRFSLASESLKIVFCILTGFVGINRVLYKIVCPDHTNAFFKSIHLRFNQNKAKYFPHTSVFVFFFSPFHTNAFHSNAYFLICFRLTFTLKHRKTLMEATLYDAFFGTIFKSLRFHLPHYKPSVFKTMHLPKAPLFAADFESFRFHQRFLSF